MSEETKKENIEDLQSANELSDEDLESAAGGLYADQTGKGTGFGGGSSNCLGCKTNLGCPKSSA